MISDITLGQFFPGKSMLHRLDPRSKILIATMYIVAVFFANNLANFALMLASTLFLVLVSRISIRVLVKGLKPLIFVLIFTAVINIFLTGGEGDPLVNFWVINIYKEGIFKAVFMAVRVVLLIIGTSVLLTYTTYPISLTDGIERLLSPLKLIKIPVHLFAMMMTIALRFIPTLVEETEKIMNAQKARGADFSSGNLIRRAKALIPILVPLFVSSFKRAEELATAMECRCYRGDKNRTKLVKLSYNWLDFVWLFAAVALTALTVFLRFLPNMVEFSSLVLDVIFYGVI